MESCDIESERVIAEPALHDDLYFVWGRYQPGMAWVIISGRELLTKDDALVRANHATECRWGEVYIGRIPGAAKESA